MFQGARGEQHARPDESGKAMNDAPLRYGSLSRRVIHPTMPLRSMISRSTTAPFGRLACPRRLHRTAERAVSRSARLSKRKLCRREGDKLYDQVIRGVPP